MENIENDHISQYRPKTKSKFYYDDEIIGVDTDGVIHLKEGVRRLTYNPLEEMVEEAYTEFKLKMNNLVERRERLRSEENDFN